VSGWGWLGVAALGAAGANARFIVHTLIARRRRSSFPLGTLVVNLTGAFVLGLLVGLAVSGQALTLAGSGAIGSYTTFSTWMFETHRLSDSGRVAAAGCNALGALLTGVAAAALGRVIGAHLLR
jgi:CrcB protein